METLGLMETVDFMKTLGFLKLFDFSFLNGLLSSECVSQNDVYNIILQRLWIFKLGFVQFIICRVHPKQLRVLQGKVPNFHAKRNEKLGALVVQFMTTFNIWPCSTKIGLPSHKRVDWHAVLQYQHFVPPVNVDPWRVYILHTYKGNHVRRVVQNCISFMNTSGQNY